MAWWTVSGYTHYSRLPAQTALNHVKGNFYQLLCLAMATILLPVTLWLSFDRYYYTGISGDTDILAKSKAPRVLLNFVLVLTSHSSPKLEDIQSGHTLCDRYSISKQLCLVELISWCATLL